MKLWISTAATPHGNEYGLVAVVAETREEAMAKARAKLDAALATATYAPARDYARVLLDGLGDMREADNGVVIDWTPAERSVGR